MKRFTLALSSSIAVVLGASPAVAQCTDAYEPDNSAFESTALITDGETQHRTFCDNSVDWVGFSACAGHVYTIETSNLGDQTDTVLEVYSPEGDSRLAINDDGNGGSASRIVWTATTSAIFRVRVHQADNSHGLDREYDLTLKGPTTACDLWTHSSGGSEWDESVALVQRRDGRIMAAGRTESHGYLNPVLWFQTLNMDGTLVGQKVTTGSTYATIFGATHAAARDRSGNLLIVGEASSYVSQGLDSIIFDYGLDGTSPSWMQVGGLSDDYSNSFAILGDGSIAVAGSTLSSGAGGLDGWLYRIGAGFGSPVAWQRTMGGSGNEEFHSVIANANGDLTVAGYTTSFGAGQKDGFVARLDSSGHLLWSRVLGRAGSDEFRRVFETPDGGLLLLGTTTGSTLVVAANIWLAKLDGQGQVLWERIMGAGGDDRVLGALAVSDGYVLAGYSDSTASGDYDGLLLKIDMNGNLLWTRTYGGTGLDRLYDVIQAVDGSLVAAGLTKSSGSGLADSWILKTAFDGAIGASCAATTAPQMTLQPRTSSVIDPGLTAVEMIGVSGGISTAIDSDGLPDNLRCRLLAPSEVSGPTTTAPLMFASRDDLIWEGNALNHADSFNLYRGDIAGLPLGDRGSCLGTFPTNAYTDLEEPGYSTGWFYLVTGRNALGEGTKGTNSRGDPRANPNPCP